MRLSPHRALQHGLTRHVRSLSIWPSRWCRRICRRARSHRAARKHRTGWPTAHHPPRGEPASPRAGRFPAASSRSGFRLGAPQTGAPAIHERWFTPADSSTIMAGAVFSRPSITLVASRFRAPRIRAGRRTSIDLARHGGLTERTMTLAIRRAEVPPFEGVLCAAVPQR
jgi:hypothetical protein